MNWFRQVLQECIHYWFHSEYERFEFEDLYRDSIDYWVSTHRITCTKCSVNKIQMLSWPTKSHWLNSELAHGDYGYTREQATQKAANVNGKYVAWFGW